MRKLIVSVVLTGVAVAAFGFSVVGPQEPKAWENTAILEFTNWFDQVCANGNVRVDGREDVVFHIGDTEFAREKGLSSASLRDEEWRVRSFSNNVILNGGGTRGCLYAVYHFLEDCCDIHWWSDTECDVPAARELSFPRLDLKGKPYFRFRQVYRDHKSNANWRFAVRNRLNMSGATSIPLAWGGAVEYGPPYVAHTFGRLLPFEKYGAAHPDWYSLQKDGSRQGAMLRGQLCLSNPEVLRQLKLKIREAIARGDEEWPRKGFAKPTLYALGLNDNRYHCQCTNCLAEIARVGCSGQYMRIVNSIAEEIGRERPDLLFKASAYLHTEPVPKDARMKFAKNVILSLDATKDNMVASIDDESNAYTRRFYEAWRPFASQILAYNYRITFWETTFDWPVASEFVVADKQRHYAEHGATSFMSELERNETTDMWELKFFLERRLGENPHEDGQKLIDFFMPRYYGAGAADVAAARRALRKNVCAAKGSITFFPRVEDFAWVTDATLDEMDRAFVRAAEAVRGNAVWTRRIAKSRLGLDRMRTYRHVCRAGNGVYPATLLYRHNKKLMTVVDDCGAAGGKAVRLDYSMGGLVPGDLFSAGYSQDGGSARLKPETTPKEGAWQWYCTTRLTTTKGYLYLADWQLQLATGLPEAAGREVNLRAHVKLQGPGFFPGSKLPTMAWVDLVEEKKVSDGHNL